MSVLYATLAIAVAIAQAAVDVLIDQHEVRRLIGVDAQLYYVQDGLVNSYAVGFNMSLTGQHSRLRFVWRRKTKDSIQYSFRISYDNTGALMKPQLSIPLAGEIPRKRSEFSVLLQCSGKLPAKVFVQIHLNFTWPSREKPTHLTIKRFQFCQKSTQYAESAGNSVPIYSDASGRTFDRSKKRDSKKHAIYDGPLTGPSSADSSNDQGQKSDYAKSGGQSAHGAAIDPVLNISVTPINILFIAIGCVCGFVLIIGIMVVTYFYRSRRYGSQASERPSSMAYGGCGMAGAVNLRNSHYPLPSSTSTGYRPQQQQPFLRPESPSATSKYSGCTGANSSAGGRWSSGFKLYSPVPSILMAEPRQIDIQGAVAEMSIDRQLIRIAEILQEGTFGEVQAATVNGATAENNDDIDYANHLNHDSNGNDMILPELTDAPVLVKSLKDFASQCQIDAFLHEGLSFYGLPGHSNIFQVLRLAYGNHGPPPLLMYSFPMHGNLKKFLIKCRSEPGSYHALSTRDLVLMAIQIVSGMIHLHRHRIIHKDLAARNCVLDDNLTIKISDTALARDLFPADYDCIGDNENRPIKWLAHEALIKHEFSTASDVWSFGVTLWELMTLAQQPYADLDPFEMATYLEEGCRLQQPHNCPDELFGIIFCCWGCGPEVRPPFPQLDSALKDFYNALLQFV